MPDSQSTVVSNRDLGGGVWLLRLRGADIVDGMVPGRFVMLACGPELAPLLRRPFSIQRASGDVYEVLYRVVGEGTGLMAKMREGQAVKVLGPLGNSFTLPAADETAILLGGGVGVPPMVALADHLEDSGHRAWEAYLGVASTADAGCLVGFDERWPDDDRVVRATMDGSLGFEGHVVAAWLDRRAHQAPGRPVRLYACGPMVMLRAIADEAARYGLPCEVSVETMMGCGMGACMSCVIENKRHADADDSERAAMNPYDRWLLACRQGPVFASDRVVLDEGAFLH